MATFNFTYDPGTTIQQMIGFEVAGRIWGTYLTDNVTINLQVGVSSLLGSKIIGGALPGMKASQDYLSYRTALALDAKSADDRTAVAWLPATNYSGKFDIVSSTGAYATQTLPATTLNLTRATAKAAGAGLSNTTTLDGYVLFSNLANTTVNGQTIKWSYDYTRSSTQASNTLDFLSTAIHEIGHVLGFGSGVDQPGWLTLRTSLDSLIANSSTFSDYWNNVTQRISYSNPLDLFRFSGVTPGVNDLSYGTPNGLQRYLSFDGGLTQIAQFSSGVDTSMGGDGYQASHFKKGTTAIMDPTLSLNKRESVGAIDLRAFDVIGWDVATNGVNTSLNLSTLQSQAIQALATRAGQTTTWITSNLTTSSSSLTSNRYLDVYNMAVDSQIYGLTRPTSTTTTSSGTPLTLSQLISQVYSMMKTLGLFSTVDEIELSDTASAAVPVQGTVIQAIVQLSKQSGLDGFNSLANRGQTLTIDVSSESVPAVKPQSLVASGRRSTVSYYGDSRRISSSAKPGTLPTLALEGLDIV